MKFEICSYLLEVEVEIYTCKVAQSSEGGGIIHSLNVEGGGIIHSLNVDHEAVISVRLQSYS